MAVDKALPYAPSHYYGLVVFVIIDLVVAGYAFARPTAMAFTAAAVWSIIRIFIQFADVSQGHAVGFNHYRDFADYLFNPMSPMSATVGNSLGIPGAFIDLIIVLEIIVIVVAWGARSTAQTKS